MTRPGPRRRQRTLGAVTHAVHEWAPADGGETGETVVLLHGWMDTARSLGPLVDALDNRRRYLGLDWRGFGDSAHAPDGRYAITDYLADLDAFLDAELPPEAAVTLIGHSLGGNVAGLYAGVRPGRVQRLVSLEGFGLADAAATEAPGRYRRWLDALGNDEPRCYASAAALAARIRHHNPRLDAGMADFLATCWSRPDGDGVALKADARHRHPRPVPYRLAEMRACWQCIQAPVLWLHGADSRYARDRMADPDWPSRTAAFRDLTVQSVPGCGHSLIHEAPLAVARAIEAWLARE